MVMTTLYRVLFEYHPKEPWRAWRIGRDITRTVLQLGFVPLPDKDPRYHNGLWASERFHAHVRKRTLKKEDAAQWHQDGDYGHVRMDHGIILWSSTHPTLIKPAYSRWTETIAEVQPKPFEVIYFDNQATYHRRPPDAPRDRWIYRMRVLK